MSPDLFDFGANNNQSGEPNSGPLAHRMRPRSLDEFFGQERVLGPGKPLRRWVEAGRVPSLILWGPPGCGKTTLASLISKQTQSDFKSLSAVLAGTKDIKEVVESARQLKKMYRRETILFVDEIHRFNKAQQDVLLPHVEEGAVTLIGATTENPSFEMNSALLSRTRVIRLERLSVPALIKTLELALEDRVRGLGGLFQLSPEAFEKLAQLADGDGRRALVLLETLSHSLEGDLMQVPLTVDQVRAALEDTLEKQPLLYDKSGEEHYNVISAFIKSLRDSDPHAGLYYLARMLEGGEDPLFIVRRLVIFASEDIGNADPRALQLAIATKDAVEFVGMPEARINLAQAVTYLALSPKSNASYLGINLALDEVRQSGSLPVPFHIRNAVTNLMKKEGYGQGYQYAHDQPPLMKQTHLPTELLGKRFYEPKGAGFEKYFKERLEQLDPTFE